jgi:hypothetical protein
MAVAETDVAGSTTTPERTGAERSRRLEEKRLNMVDVLLSKDVGVIEGFRREAEDARESLATLKGFHPLKRQKLRNKELEADYKADKRTAGMINLLSQLDQTDDVEQQLRIAKAEGVGEGGIKSIVAPGDPTLTGDRALEQGEATLDLAERQRRQVAGYWGRAMYRAEPGKYGSVEEAIEAAEASYEEHLLTTHLREKMQKEWELTNGRKIDAQALETINLKVEALRADIDLDKARKKSLLQEAKTQGVRLPGLHYDAQGDLTPGSEDFLDAASGSTNITGDPTTHSLLMTMGMSGADHEKVIDNARHIFESEFPPAVVAAIGKDEGLAKLFNSKASMLEPGAELKFTQSQLEAIPGANMIEKRENLRASVEGAYWKAHGIRTASDLAQWVLAGRLTGRMPLRHATDMIGSWARSSANTGGAKASPEVIADFLAEDGDFQDLINDMIGSAPELRDVLRSVWTEYAPMQTVLDLRGVDRTLVPGLQTEAERQYRGVMKGALAELTDRIQFDPHESATAASTAARTLFSTRTGAVVGALTEQQQARLEEWESLYASMAGVAGRAGVEFPDDGDAIFASTPITRLLGIMGFYANNKAAFDAALDLEDQVPEPVLRRQIGELAGEVQLLDQRGELTNQDAKAFQALQDLESEMERRTRFGVKPTPADLQRLGILGQQITPDTKVGDLDPELSKRLGTGILGVPLPMKPGETKRIVSEVLPNHPDVGAIEKAARQWGMSGEELINKIIFAESSDGKKLVSPDGARGPMQMLKSTAKDMGVENIDDPTENITGGIRYLAWLLRRPGIDGDLALAVAAYNTGVGVVQKVKGIPDNEETPPYVRKILGAAATEGRMAP